MALSTRLDLRQSQALVMTPQLQQAIKLLQLSNLELAAYVEQQIEENPFLEGGESVAETEGAEAAPSSATDDGSAPDGGEEAIFESDYGASLEGEAVDDNLWNGSSERTGESAADSLLTVGTWGKTGQSDFPESDDELEIGMTGRVSLRDHLIEQINCDLADPIDRLIALDLIELLDEAGYLTGDLDAVAERLGCTRERVAATLEKLQGFDPPGIFACTLSECLALQLRERDRLDPAMQALIENLDLLGKRDMKTLIKRCGVDAEDLAEMIAEIRALNPKPALAFDTVTATPITPDILMRPRPDGGWHLELNPDTLPRVLVNNRYYVQISRSSATKEDKQYIQDQYQAANWLAKALHQRAKTILRVAEEIVRQQERFFLKGVEYLRPLVLRDIAEVVGMHESTVSRVTSNKYIETPRGIYELKYFFTNAIPSASGEAAHSSEAIRHRIKTLIENERPDDVLSDDRIVAMLQAEGVDIARRTVAKYREALNIPSSVARRREKLVEI